MNAVAVATPELLVVAVTVEAPPAKVPLAPEPGAVNVTVTLGTVFPLLSFTVADSAVAKAWATVALCGVPAVAVIDAAAPGTLVRAKLAGVPTPETVAVTLYVPAMVLAVNAGAVATPDALVATTAV